MATGSEKEKARLDFESGLNVSFPQSSQTMATGQVANPRFEQFGLDLW